MTTVDSAVSTPAGQISPAVLRLAPALFAGTLLVSAFLLFAVQPMFTKMVLPRLGGAPAVWSVAMVFFQAALLVGYAYAHLLARQLAPGHAALVHVGLLAVAAASLPIGIAAGFAAPPATGVAIWVVGLFSLSIGLPFVALSASAPLLQSWFAASGHAQAGNPYVLYAASNLGSFAALIAYPFVIEPFLPLRDQAMWWSIGFALLSVLIAVGGAVVARAPNMRTLACGPDTVTPADRLRWAALAAIPVGLVIAVTAYVTTDVASAPFLWVLPLALYLLTFVAVFRDRPWIRHAAVVRLVPYVVAPLAISALGGDKVYWLATIALHLLAFFVLALVCHGEVYGRRPSPQRLTEFYLWTSLGGVIGGVFAGLVAPNVFNNTYEYPILIAVALLAVPGTLAGGVRGVWREAWPMLTAAAAIACLGLTLNVALPAGMEIAYQVALVGLAALMLCWRHQPERFFGVAIFALVFAQVLQPGTRRVETARSFFGVHQVSETADRQYRLLRHGTTIHGVERIRDAEGRPVTGRPEPLAYFYFGGPISEAIDAQREARGGLGRKLDHVAVVGLGTGSLACHKRVGEDWTFFEIDPQVIRIARDPRLFRFLSACAPDTPIVLGDARLTLADAQARYDLIVLDAFSSDAIPVHLLTREAFAGYLARLTSSGTLVLHISNRHMELARVVAAVGRAEGLVTFVKRDNRASHLREDFRANALVAVLARDRADLGDLPDRQGWRRVEPDPAVVAWTDDYSDILGAILRMKRER